MRGWDVTLVEQYTPGTVRSASGGDTRLMRAAHGDAEWYAASAQRARTLWLDLEQTTGTHIWEGVGLAWLATRARTASKRRASPSSSASTIPHEWLTPDDARALFPSLAVDDLHGVLFEPDAGVLLARRATQLLVADGERHGVKLEGSRMTPSDDPRGRHRRLGVRRVASAALPRARDGRGLAPRRLLPRRRPVVAGSTRIRRLRRRVLRARRRRRASASRSPRTRRTTPSTPTRSIAGPRPHWEETARAYAARRFPRSPAHRSSAVASASTTSPRTRTSSPTGIPRTRGGGSSAAAPATASSTARRWPSTSPTASKASASASPSMRSGRAPATRACAPGAASASAVLRRAPRTRASACARGR